MRNFSVKRILVVVAMLIQILAARAALATQIPVDFSVLGINAVDITTTVNPAGLTLNGATFRYDDLGSGVDFALADAAGIFGTTGGSLLMDFDSLNPSNGLNFDFGILGAASDVTDAIFVALTLLGSPVDQFLLPAAFDGVDTATGSFAYSGTSFDQALMFFSLSAPFFSVSNVSYGVPDAVNSVPEPGMFILLASGLVGMYFWRRFARC